mmetsp:Transcript_30978/g.77597  ORF Transcript_30978/g.77597 Transcript_30978/m.77597 type:complete len:164 (-) Transcript_30978:352-843(-)
MKVHQHSSRASSQRTLLRMGVGIAGAAMGSPFQMIKIRMQSYSSKASMAVGDQHKYKSLAHGLRTVLREEGLAGWRRAMDACMLKVAIASAVQLSVYDGMKGRLQRSETWNKRFGSTETHIAASVAASFAVVSVINPLEVQHASSSRCHTLSTPIRSAFVLLL